MSDNLGVVILGGFIAAVVLGGLAVVLGGGDVATFTDSMASLAVPIVFIAVVLAGIGAYMSG